MRGVDVVVSRWGWINQRREADTPDPKQFVTETFRHHSDGSEASGHFGTSTKCSKDTPDLSAELSSPMVRNVSP